MSSKENSNNRVDFCLKNSSTVENAFSNRFDSDRLTLKIVNGENKTTRAFRAWVKQQLSAREQ